MKLIKRIISSIIIAVFATVIIFPISGYAAQEGWVEISVTVPQSFTDQVYVTLQNVEEVEENSDTSEYEVQILRHNDYIGRIELPEGSYEISSIIAYENPDNYVFEVASDTNIPIVVTGNITAVSVNIICKEVNESNSIVDSSQDTQKEEDKTSVENTDNIEDNEDEDANQKAKERIANSLLSVGKGAASTLIQFAFFAGLGYLYFKYFRKK